MKKFLRRIGLFCLIQLFVGVLLVANSFQHSRYGYFAAFEDKINLLQEHAEHSLIVLGGSNVAFGIDSAALESQTGMPVINGGLHSELGLQFYLDVATRYAKRGDTIILIPEWDLLAGKLEPTQWPLQQLIRQSPSAWQLVLNSDSFDFKSFVDNHALGELAYMVQTGLSVPNKSKDQREADKAKMPGEYSRLNFDHRGDFVGHHKLGTKNGIGKLPVHFAKKTEYYEVSTKAINECSRTLMAKGAKLYLAYCPIPQPQYEKAKSDIAEAHNFLTRNLDVCILHEPGQTVYPAAYFYDTVCHLNLKGKTARTELVAHTVVKNARFAKTQNNVRYR